MNGVSFSPNNQYVVSGSLDRTVRIWDVESGDCIKRLGGHTGYVSGVSFSVKDFGGSLTDGAKAIVLCLALDLSTPKSMSPYRGSSITGSDANYTLDPTKIITLVCIPTTLSGGEFTPLAGVSDLSKTPKRKEGFSHPLLQPKVILYDPQLTRHTPEWLFLSTGIRAMDHCIEAICSIALGEDKGEGGGEPLAPD